MKFSQGLTPEGPDEGPHKIPLEIPKAENQPFFRY